MTFEQWWARAQKDAVPFSRPRYRDIERASYAQCWNAAIEQARRWLAAPAKSTEHTDLMAHALKVKP
jgi:hypothetical protein